MESKISNVHDEINMDVTALRERLYRTWMACDKISQGQLAREIGISEYSLRFFLDKNKERRYTRTVKMRIYKWITNAEKKHNLTKEN